MNRWCHVREDLLYAFRKSIDSGLEPPLKDVVAAFLARVQGGMALDTALDLMQQALRHDHFQDLVTAIRFNFRYRGDLPALLEHLEWQYNRIEEEYVRRKLANARDRRVTALVLLLVPLCCLLRFSLSPASQQLFSESSLGRMLLLCSGLIYLLSAAGFFLIRSKMHLG